MPQPWDNAAILGIFDIAGQLTRSDGRLDKLPRTPVHCKPNFKAVKTAIEMYTALEGSTLNMSKAVFMA
uniref:Predicted protein n=1 Tax=Hordeum vulgare subsp. vulgare TaxID=112509 RepID=F2D2A4_HORVV|nr:predicted protein [Hordeum vulgare subsp. vulgare]